MAQKAMNAALSAANRLGGQFTEIPGQFREMLGRFLPTKPTRRSRAKKWAGYTGGAAGLVAAGAGLMYLFDPDRGRSRRARAGSRAQSTVRRGARKATWQTNRQAHYLEGKLKGAAMKAAGKGRYHPASEVDLREHLRQVIRTLPVSSADVTVDVCMGMATLRGQVRDAGDQRLIRDAVMRVPGVLEVQDFLHLPGTPAPNKAAALSASGNNGAVWR